MSSSNIQPSWFDSIDSNFIQMSSTKPSSEFDINKTEINSTVTDIVLFTEYNTAGSLFSIHSAPPLPISDLNTTINSSIAIDSDLFQCAKATSDSPGRPISLALESQQNFSTKTIAAFPLTTSEVDEDDNENLLTVSSVTARPLIAKSREIRSNK